jgi:hypothetical protein
LRFPPLLSSLAVAVGHDEQSLALVAGTDLGRAEYSCRNAAAHRFQCRDQSGELSVSISGDIFAEQTRSPAFIENSDDLLDEEPVIGGAEALSGVAVGLARIAANDAIHEASKLSSVERGDVRPHSRLSQLARRHARDQCAGGICFPFHVSDAARSGSGDVNTEAEPADSGAELDGVEGR